MLLRFDDSGAAAVHEVEAFGPVSSIFGYDTVDEAVALVARGGGSLVTTVATHDPVFAVELTTRIAAYNGRVLLLDRDDARSLDRARLAGAAPGARRTRPRRRRRGARRHPGRAAPHAAHRDPGLSRHARPRSPGCGMPARSPRPAASIRSARRSPSCKVGDQLVSPSREVTLDDIEPFAAFTGDTFYAHMDEEAAAANPFFPGRVAHGYLLVSWAAGLFVDPAPGPVLANSGSRTCGS